ncbi:MAG: hypothetical protein JWN42_1242 [Candidatus Angelobacter sp.]|nr:hypothetical protein [Candidatus Angelobacter sp.]
MEDPVLCNLKSGVGDSMLQQLPDEIILSASFDNSEP